MDWLQNLDRQILLTLNHSHTAILDWLMWQISGNLIWLPLYLFLIYFSFKTFRSKAWLIIIWIVITVGLSDFTSVHLFKETFKRLRPCHNPQLQGIIVLVHHHCGGLYGFISSHATNTFALATLIALIFRKNWLTGLMFFYATIISLSRVYLGVHYPTDVLAGAMWGSFIGWIMFKILLILKPQTINFQQNGKS